MRTAPLILVLAILSAYLASASTYTTPLDEMAYHFVKNRGEPPQLSIFIPSIGFAAKDGYKVVVIAVPYSPDDPAVDNLLKELPSKIFYAITNKDWSGLTDLFKQLRSIYYPYETFRIKLIFIVFTQTQTFIDAALDGVLSLLNDGGGKTENTQDGLSYFAIGIVNFIHENYEKSKSSIANELEKNINNVKNSLKVEVTHSGPEIRQTECEEKSKICTSTISLSLSIVITYNGIKIGESLELQIEKRYNSESNQILSNSESNQILSCELISPTKDKVVQEITKTSKDVLDIILGDNQKVVGFYNVTFPTKDQLTKVFVSAGGEDYNQFIKSLSIDINNSLYSLLYRKYMQSRSIAVNNKLPSDLTPSLNSLFDLNPHCNDIMSYLKSLPSNLENTIRENIASAYKWTIDQLKSSAESIFNNEVNEINNKYYDYLKNNIKTDSSDKYKDLDNYIINTASQITSNAVSQTKACLMNLGKTLASRASNAIISSVPIAGQIYAVANGIFGAFQKQIYIRGTIDYQPITLPGVQRPGVTGMLLKVNKKAVCLPGVTVMQASGESFTSGPGMLEALFYGIVGFFSGLLKAVGFTEAGEALDLIPIVREVNIPPGEYLMLAGSPGLYQITIEIDINNFIQQLSQNIANSIKDSLSNVYNQIKNYELYKEVINVLIKYKDDIKRLTQSGRNNMASLYSDVYKNIKPQSEGERMMTLNVYVVSSAPYAVGKFDNDKVSYGFVYDWFSILRPMLNREVSEIVSMSGKACSQQGSGSTAYQSSSKGVNDLINDACNKIFQSSINYLIETLSSGLSSFGERGAAECSIEELIRSATGTVITKFVDNIFNDIKNHIMKNVVVGTCNSISRTEVPQNVLSGFIKEYLSMFDRSSSGGLKDSLCSLYKQNEALLYSMLNVVGDYLNAPSYFLSSYSIRPPISTTVRSCYAVVASPYFIYPYQQFEVTVYNFRNVAIDYAELIGSDKGAGNALFEAISKHGLRYTFKILFFDLTVDLIKFDKNNNNVDSKYVSKILCLQPQYCLATRKYNDLVSLYRDDIFVRYVYMIDGNTVGSILRTEKDGKTVKERLEELLSVYVQDWRGVRTGVVGGVNRYFSAFKVYPAIAAREEGSGGLNAYYFVIPYSAPARELFVLGKVGSTVLYDESQPVWGKPFIYVDLVGGR